MKQKDLVLGQLIECKADHLSKFEKGAVLKVTGIYLPGYDNLSVAKLNQESPQLGADRGNRPRGKVYITADNLEHFAPIKENILYAHQYMNKNSLEIVFLEKPNDQDFIRLPEKDINLTLLRPR